MPSQYYKLRGVEGVSGGQFTDAETDELGVRRSRRREPSLTDSINQRVVGSHFQEVNRDSTAFGRLPIGSQMMLEKNGQLGPARMTESPLPHNAPYHPQGHTSWDTAAFNDNYMVQQWWTPQSGHSMQGTPDEGLLGDEWVDVLHDDPEAFQNQEDYNVDTASRRRPRPPRAKKVGTQDDRRETFPLRHRGTEEGDVQPPPHLRVQPRAPFVRPLSGLDHDDLGDIYKDIREWRSKLKSINDEIVNMQRESYNDIADGARIKGWLLIGRGLRHLPGIQLIEGRAKEDIRWDELQNERSRLRTVMFWALVLVVGILLGIGSKYFL
jgi:calcium permeable stress-gated cation channel